MGKLPFAIRTAKRTLVRVTSQMSLERVLPLELSLAYAATVGFILRVLTLPVLLKAVLVLEHFAALVALGTRTFGFLQGSLYDSSLVVTLDMLCQ